MTSTLTFDLLTALKVKSNGAIRLHKVSSTRVMVIEDKYVVMFNIITKYNKVSFHDIILTTIYQY